MSGDNGESKAHPQWASSWREFGAELQHRIHESASSDDLSRQFGGQQVTWEGRIERIDIDALAGMVDVGLDEIEILFPDGATVRLDGVSLPVATDTEGQWRQLAVGSTVSFQATILPMGSAPFPPIELKTLPSGARLIMLRLSDATPHGSSETRNTEQGVAPNS